MDIVLFRMCVGAFMLCVLTGVASCLFAQEPESDRKLGAEVAKYCKVKVSAIMEGPYAVIVSSLAVTPNGDLLCIYPCSKEVAKAAGLDIHGKCAALGRISRDNGETWERPFVVIDCPEQYFVCDPALARVGNKIIAIGSVDVEAYDPPKGKIKLWQTESVDNGKTWTQPRALPIPRTRPAVSGRTGIVLKDGTVLMPYWWDFMIQTGALEMAQIGDIPTVCGAMISKDAGKTWSLSTDVYGEWSEQPKVLRTADEPAIAAVSGKDVLMVIRSTEPDGRTNEAWSRDGGATWELPKPSPITSYNTPSCLYVMKNGWIVRMWDDSINTNRFPLVVSISKDRGKTWSVPKTVVEFPDDSHWPVQASYPNVVEAADGSLVATWCHTNPDGRWFLACGKFSPQWVLEETKPIPIVAFGDSVTLGVRDVIEESDTFRQILQNRLEQAGYSIKIINAGVGGSNTEDAVSRLGSDVLRHHPRIVIINFGINDAALVDGPDQVRDTPRVSEERFKQNLVKMVEDIRTTGGEVILCTPTPMTREYAFSNLGAYASNDMNYLLKRYAGIVKQVSRRYHTELVDLFTYFTADKKRLQRIYDGCHPDAQGQSQIADQLYPALTKLLK